jgi:ribose 1,5-bisphosphokinase PhnN
MLTRDEEAQLIGYLSDEARRLRRAAELLSCAAGHLLAHRYGPALGAVFDAEQNTGHDIITQPERDALREMQREYPKRLEQIEAEVRREYELPAVLNSEPKESI